MHSTGDVTDTPATHSARTDGSTPVGRAAIPLRYRVPNAPLPYEGRAEEERWLVDGLSTGTYCVVVGPGGMGKTSLVLHTVQHYLSEGANAMYVDVRPSETAEDIRVELARALLAVHPMEGVDWANMVGDSDALGAVVIDLAETGGWTVILDDAQNAKKGSVAAFIQQLEKYARRSRWVIATREVPEGLPLEDRVRVLQAMPTEDLLRLAQACAPEQAEDSLGEAVNVAEGSPWRLLQALAAPDVGPEAKETELLEGIGEEGRRVLEAAAIFQVPVQTSVLMALSQSSDDELERLIQRGVIEKTGESCRLHDVVRDLLSRSSRAQITSPGNLPAISITSPGMLLTVPPEAFAQQRREAAELLAKEDDPVSWLEAVRLLGEPPAARTRDSQPPPNPFGSALAPFAHERITELKQLLQAHGRELLDSGYAHRLWRLLGTPTDPELLLWSLRCAVELGDPDVFSRISAPPVDTGEGHYLWARALFAQGRLQEAAEAARVAMERAPEANEAQSMDGTLPFQAGFLYARSLGNLSRWQEAIDVFESLEPQNLEEHARRDLIVARCLVLAGDGGAASERVEHARKGLRELKGHARLEMIYSLADLLHELGRTDEAAELMERADRERGEASTLLYSQWGRRALYQRATFAISRGDLDSARDVLASLWPFMGKASFMRPHLLLAEAIVRLASGELAQVPELLVEVREEGLRRKSSGMYAAAHYYLCRYRTVQFDTTQDTVDPAMMPPPETLFGGLLAMSEAQGALRRGETVPYSVFEPFVERNDLPELRAGALVVACEAAIVRGDSSEALKHAEIAVEESKQGRLGIPYALASGALCSALSIMGRVSSLQRTANEMFERADEMPSIRFEVEAEFYQAVSSEKPTAVSQVASLAAARESSPMTARRAAALLGSDVPLDALDRKVVDALRSRDPWCRIERADAAEDPTVDFRGAWGLDAGTMEVWLPGGRRVDLSQRALLWRLLLVLADKGGRATKEELVLGAWDVEEYHPLRHDNRLQVAMRKLRRAIEEDASRPARVVTTEDGYALAGPVLLQSPPARMSELPPPPS